MSYKKSKLLLISVIICASIISTSPNVMGNGDPPYNIYIPANTEINIIYEFIRPTYFIFNFSTNVNVNLNLNFSLFAPLLSSRQISVELYNDNDITLNCTAIFDVEGFLNDLPENPTFQDIFLSYNYNSFYKIRANDTITKLSLFFLKLPSYGFEIDENYSIGYHLNEVQGNPILINTKESQQSGFDYINGTVENLEGEKDYYLTVYETTQNPPTPRTYEWLWILLPIGIGIISSIIVISKRDYFRYLMKRQTPLNKGAHRLTMEEVLENENRSKIIDLILKEPGIHFNELLRQTDLAPGNLVWHLDILESYKVIAKKRVGNYVMYIPYYSKNPLSNIDLKLQKSELTLEVLEMIEENPGIWNGKITDKMEIHRKTIQYHIDKLIDLGLVYKVKEGNKKKIFLNLEADYFNKSPKKKKKIDLG